MRPGSEAPYSDVQVVGVTFGVPGKLQVNRSSLLANSVHSCASAAPGIDRIHTAAVTRIRRMVVLLRMHHALLASGRAASLGAALVAIHHVAVRARGVELIADGD